MTDHFFYFLFVYFYGLFFLAPVEDFFFVSLAINLKMWNERSDDHFKKSFLPHSIGLYFISIGGKQNELALYRGNSNLRKQLIDKMLWSCDIGGEGA